MSLALRNLYHQKSKVAISIAGVTLSVFLILTMSGLYLGFSTMMDNMVTHSGADLWVTSEGASGSLHSPSLLPLNIRENLSNIEGVDTVSPLIRQPLSTTLKDDTVLLYINGYDTDTGMGGPWSMASGNSDLDAGEIVIDKVLASQYGYDIGDNITIEEKEFKIIGLSDKSYIMIAYIIFLSFDDAKSFLLEGVTNYFLVSVADGFTDEEVSASIVDTITDVSVSTTSETAKAYKDEVIGGFIPVFWMLSGIGYLVGIQIIGVLIHSITMENSKEFGILKAVGATNFDLYRVVAVQAFIISALGFTIGSIVVPVLISIIQTYVPEFVVEIDLQMIMQSSFLGTLTGLLTSILPARRIAQIDPALVFKEV